MVNLSQMRIPQLERILDSEVSQYVRRLYSVHGWCQCYTCGLWLTTQEATCGHFILRRHRGTRWNLNNLRVQCLVCQGNEGEAVKFEARLTAEIGAAAVAELMALKHLTMKHPRAWFIAEIEKYRGMA